MSTDTQSPAPPTRFERVDPRELVISDCNERSEDTTPSKEFVDDVRLNGIEDPPLTRPAVVDGADFEVVAGQIRRNGAIEAGLDEITIKVKDLSDHEAIVASTRENVRGQMSTPVSLAERCNQVQRAIDKMDYLDPSPTALAEEFGVSRSTMQSWIEPLKDFWTGTPVDPTYHKPEPTYDSQTAGRTLIDDGVWVIRGVAQHEPLDLGGIGGRTLSMIRNIQTDDFAAQVELAALVAGDLLTREDVGRIKSGTENFDHSSIEAQIDLQVPYQGDTGSRDQDRDQSETESTPDGASTIEDDGWEVDIDTDPDSGFDSGFEGESFSDSDTQPLSGSPDGWTSEVESEAESEAESETDTTADTTTDTTPEIGGESSDDDGETPELNENNESNESNKSEEANEDGQNKQENQENQDNEDNEDDEDDEDDEDQQETIDVETYEYIKTNQSEPVQSENHTDDRQIGLADDGFALDPDEEVGVERIKELHEGLEMVVAQLESEDDPGKRRVQRLMFNHVAHKDLQAIMKLLFCPINGQSYTHVVADGRTIPIDEAIALSETAYRNYTNQREEMAGTEYESVDQDKRGFEVERQEIESANPSD